MSTAVTPAIPESGKPGQAPSPNTIGPIPPDCSPDRFLDWRMRYAHHLAQHTAARPIEHEDSWVQMAANVFAHQLDGPTEPKPTPLNLTIGEALKLHQSDTLERHVLDARLLAQEEPEEIARRSRLSPLTICAYSTLLFDVRGRDRKGIWTLAPFSNGVVVDSEVGQFGFALKQTACFKTSEDFEAHLEVLFRLDGKTLADGLPDQATPASARELAIRLTLAKSLLPNTRPTEKLLRRFDEVATRDIVAGRASSETTDLAVQILQKAKIPATLMKEIRRVRELRSQAAAVATTAEPAGTVAGVAK